MTVGIPIPVSGMPQADEGATSWLSRVLQCPSMSGQAVWASTTPFAHRRLGAWIWTTCKQGLAGRVQAFSEDSWAFLRVRHGLPLEVGLSGSSRKGFRNRPSQDPLVEYLAADLDVITFAIGRAGAHWPGLAGSRSGCRFTTAASAGKRHRRLEIRHQLLEIRHHL